MSEFNVSIFGGAALNVVNLLDTNTQNSSKTNTVIGMNFRLFTIEFITIHTTTFSVW